MPGTYSLIPELPHSSNSQFDEFWMTYPKRMGSNPKKTARAKWDYAVNRLKVDPAEILAAVQKMKVRDKEMIGTPYIPMAATWLNGARWEEFSYIPATRLGSVQNNAPAGVYVAFSERDAWDAYGRSIGKTYPRDSRGGWYFPSREPPSNTNSPGIPVNERADSIGQY